MAQKILQELNSLAEPFELETQMTIVKLDTLKIDKPHLIEKIIRCKPNKFGVPVLAKLKDNLGVFLPQRIAEKITDNQLKHINDSASVCLVYKGQTIKEYFGKTISKMEFVQH